MMLKRLKAGFEAWKTKRQQAEQIKPDAFKRLAAELVELAVVARRVYPESEAFQAKLLRIEDEMNQLEAMTAKPEFRKLSATKLMELRESLLASKDQLMETVSSGAPPTNLPQ